MCKGSFDESDESFGLIHRSEIAISPPRRMRSRMFTCFLIFILICTCFLTSSPYSRSVDPSPRGTPSRDVPNVAILLQSSPESFSHRVKQIRETWGARVRRKPSLGLFFVVGNVTDGESDMLKSDCDEGYFSGICRLGFALQYVYEASLYDPAWMKFEWFLFADDDVYILPDNLQRMVLALGEWAHLENKAFCLPGCVTDYCVGYCGGGGVLMSRYIVNRVVNERDGNKFGSLIDELRGNDALCTQYHDVSFGFFLEHNRTNISMAPYPYDPFAFGFKDNFEMMRSLKNKQSLPWLYHYPSRGAMYWLDNMIKDLGTNIEINDEVL